MSADDEVQATKLWTFGDLDVDTTTLDVPAHTDFPPVTLNLPDHQFEIPWTEFATFRDQVNALYGWLRNEGHLESSCGCITPNCEGPH